MRYLLLLALLPVAILLIYIYRKDVNKEPISKLILAFAVGCFSVFPAVVMELILTYVGNSYGIDKFPIAEALFEGYVVAGFSEELCKLALLMLVIWRSRAFNEYFDGIIYAAYISLGFAAVENILYVLDDGGIQIAVTRGILAVPGHFLDGVAMGYYLSFARFDPIRRSSHLAKALFIPVLLHGTYDAILMVADKLDGNMEIIGGLLMIAFIYFDVRLWRYGLRRIRQMENLSRQKGFNPNDPFGNFRWNV